MATKNRVFPYIGPKFVLIVQNCQTVFNPIPSPKIALFLLLFHCNLDLCFTYFNYNTFSCSLLYGSSVTIPTSVSWYAKSELYVLAELFKRIPFGVSVFVERNIFIPSMPTIILRVLHAICYIYNGLFSGLTCSAVILKLILVQEHYLSGVGI